MADVKEIIASFEKACSEGNFAIAEELIIELHSIGPEVETNNEIYSQAVAKAIETFQGKFSSLKLKKLLANVQGFVKNYPKNTELVFSYAQALRHSLAAMRTKGQPNAMKEIMDSLEKLVDNHPENISLHEELSAASHEMVHF